MYFEQVCITMSTPSVSGFWHNGVAQLLVPIEIAIGADDNVINLGRYSLDDVRNQRFAPVFLQALVGAVQAFAKSSGQDDAAVSMLVHKVLNIE